jgi:hypothetical protein
MLAGNRTIVGNISTKVWLAADDLTDIPGAIERSLEQSLKRLRLERVALLQLHNKVGRPVDGQPSLTPARILGEVADTFDRLKEQELIQASGITAIGETRACRDVIESGRFDAAQSTTTRSIRVPPGPAPRRPGRARISAGSSPPAGASIWGCWGSGCGPAASWPQPRGPSG